MKLTLIITLAFLSILPAMAKEDVYQAPSHDWKDHKLQAAKPLAPRWKEEEFKVHDKLPAQRGLASEKKELKRGPSSALGSEPVPENGSLPTWKYQPESE